MVSSVTINRQKKLQLLKESLNGIIELLLMEFRARDIINMAEFKQLSSKVKIMVDTGKLAGRKFTRNSEFNRVIPITRQEDTERHLK